MPQSLVCPECQRKLQIPDELAGRRLRCPACKTIFVAGQPPAEAPQMAFTVAPAAPLPPAQKTRPLRQFDNQDGDNGTDDRPRSTKSDENRPRRRSPSRSRKKSASNFAVWLAVGIAGAVGVAAVMLGGAVYLLVHYGSSNKSAETARKGPVVVEDKKQRDKEVAEAFKNPRLQPPVGKKPAANPNPKVGAVTAAELNPFFKTLGQALVMQDNPKLNGLCDVERFFDELVSQNVIPQAAANDRRGFLAEANANGGLGGALGKNGMLIWTTTDIKHIKELAPNEVVVIARHQAGAGISLKMRWWLTKRSGTWKLFDYEDLDTGLRTTILVSSLAGEVVKGQTNTTVWAFRQIAEAIKALAGGDADFADEKLNAIAGVKLPPQMDAVRWCASAVVSMSRGQNEAALDALEKSHALHPDFPAVDLLKGLVYNSLGQWQKALTHLEKYRDLLGEDGLVRTELNKAKRGLGR